VVPVVQVTDNAQPLPEVPEGDEENGGDDGIPAVVRSSRAMYTFDKPCLTLLRPLTGTVSIPYPTPLPPPPPPSDTIVEDSGSKSKGSSKANSRATTAATAVSSGESISEPQRKRIPFIFCVNVCLH
jgi:hypothetical protein